MRIKILSILLLFGLSTTFAQRSKSTYQYTNGAIKAKGNYLRCPDFNPRYPCYKGTCRKIGKWKYYYQNGNIQRIENYKKIKGCLTDEEPIGDWMYYDETGKLIKVERYLDGKLWHADIAQIYQDLNQVGGIIVREGIIDTVFDKKTSIDYGLIYNNDFSLSFNAPTLQYSDGQQNIEEQIPFWFTPNNSTPDFYNQYRRLMRVPDNFQHQYNKAYDYVGIILYHNPTKDYSEYITGKLSGHLIKNKTYCLKITMRPSENSGFNINKFGIYFSSDMPDISDSRNKLPLIPQSTIEIESNDRESWKTYCTYYKATGNEKYLSIGRFFGINEINIQKIAPKNFSEGELNESAYYLFDKVELIEDSSLCSCPNLIPEYNSIDRIDFDDLQNKDSIDPENEIFNLEKIYFEFDKHELLPESEMELQNLLDFLKDNAFSITIIGHTDNRGTEEYNERLSMLRAKAVVDWLIDKGIASKRLKYVGYGAKYPIYENTDENNRALNRRVEFRINK
jgi:OmpA-OmpF porin, OOP family